MAGCSEESNYQKRKEKKPEQILERFTAFESKDGIKIWKLVAKEAQIFESESNTNLKDFIVTFFKSDGKSVDAVLQAPSGEMDMRVNNFKTQGRTIVKNSIKEVLECTDLYYNAKDKKIYSDSDVRLTRADSIVKGKGFEATPDLSSVIIKENVVNVKK